MNTEIFLDARLQTLAIGDLVGYSQSNNGINTVTVGHIIKMSHNKDGAAKVSVKPTQRGRSCYGKETSWSNYGVVKNSIMYACKVFKL